MSYTYEPKFYLVAEHEIAGIWYFSNEIDFKLANLNKDNWNIKYERYMSFEIPRQFLNPTHQKIKEMFDKNKWLVKWNTFSSI